eukprot:6251358-Alexandrium_andersonii.AAC.1
MPLGVSQTFRHRATGSRAVSLRQRAPYEHRSATGHRPLDVTRSSAQRGGAVVCTFCAPVPRSRRRPCATKGWGALPPCRL